MWAVSTTSPSKIIWLCTNGICCYVLIDNWIDILDQHSIPLSTFNRNFIVTSVNNRLTLNQHLINKSVKSKLLFKRCMVGLFQLTVNWSLTRCRSRCQLRCQSKIMFMSIEYQLGCRLSVHWDVNQGLIQDVDWQSTADAFITRDFIINPQIYPSISSSHV